MSKRFPEYSGLNLPEINDSVLEKWSAEDVFARTMSEREGCPSFVFFEGPPSANGKPGIHHVLARTIKDIFCRYKTMQGFQVKRKAGWDTHGLPVELGVEKNLGITKEDIGKKISVNEYNAACRREVMKYTGEWEDLTRRMGYWVDMPNAYITYDNRYIESVWWLLGELYKKGYLYKGYTIQPYSPAAGTGLSSHELNQPGCYRDVKDTTCVAQFRVVDDNAPALAPYRDILFKWGTPYFLAWTTTPWTLPSNTALAVGPDITYNIVRTYNPYSGKPVTVVAADALMGSLFNAKAKDLPLDSYSKGDKLIPYEVAAQVKGLDLVGINYEQLLPWVNPGEGAFRVIPGDYVTTEDGTGIVHIAGTFGADDLRVSKQNAIPPLHLIDRDGNIRPMVDLTGRFYLLSDLDPKFVEEMVDIEAYTPWQGQYVKNAYDPEATEETETLDVKICMELKATDKVFKIEKHTHNYPHCWRTDKPVLYYPLDSWFIKTTAVRERLMELNDSIKWKPASTGSGRFGKWLENLQDWNLSRSRYWGTPLPIWRTEDGAEELCISSVEQLYTEIEHAVEAGLMTENPYKKAGFVPGNYTKDNYEKIDLHRPYVDDIILLSPSGKAMRREKDLIDVWFDSGSMPYAQIHYPFENKEAFDNREVYPADFIAEGVDQTRGWFFTLHAIAGMVFDSISYKTVISNGLVLDKYGNKMSKRLGNAVDPFGQIGQYGADPVRWYMISNSSPWDNLKYDEKGVLETSRKLFSTLYNTYSFFALYANVDSFDPSAPQVPVEKRPEIDRWILSLLNTLIREVTEALDDYEPTRAARAIGEFVGDNLSNWYVRLNRKRFWGGDMTDDKLAAYQTLYTCLHTVTLLMAPFAPFFADRLYRDLTGSENSIHLDRYPVADPSLIDPDLEERQKLAQDITSMALALRRKVNLKVRQPLHTIMVPVADEKRRAAVEAIMDLVKSEINVKDLKIVGNDEGILVKSVKPDFKKLGPKFGKNMKAAAEIIKNLDAKSIAALERDGRLSFDLNGTPAEVELSDVEIISEDIPGWLVANEGSLTIALDVTVTPELRREGIARDIVNRIQNIRKARNYDITDRIRLVFAPGADTDDAIRDFADYISRQVLATSLEIVPLADSAEGIEELSMDDVTARMLISLDK
ncbi:isoleucine--tRNA ligase [Muribaculaceae bacterium Isolate-083 (Janvier)]|uniref:isoleucine--tRNA ligase n=1 Tax=Duncaniella muris TaxID=2094150 RepID=UPI000F475E64|nr:isoleucine--tRNA ligase [Duncaniella muris]ROS97942.1 isoleucine--tRNA ligase [Muribaculaceae bacterium Isolate-083 (Janvier)]ROS99158.1 isoleucine--tRNA ligase [Muribaculaceae bacterium Isolate-077 (Janvier)]ROT01898.1 isoleucine--tRNA ligase [Muribaculaceae bacterium Isolate-084 (Janvier)]